MTDSSTHNLPPHLIEEITAGNCVAFVGAGFSALSVPPWKELIRRIAEDGALDPEPSDAAQALLDEDKPNSLEAAAQIVQDAMGERAFVRSLKAQIDAAFVDDNQQRRVDLLRGIPFRAVLTTNFDGLLEGSLPGEDVYQAMLRPKGHRWWNERHWQSDQTGPQVAKLHGDVGRDDPADVVFSRRDYRRRLYSNAGYMTFLRSIFATSTVLFLGVSFTDAYLNELRSEVLALIGHKAGSTPIAYAILPDVSSVAAAHLRDHEGIEVLSYSTIGDPEHGAFDSYLDAIYRRTSPVHLLGNAIVGKRILWVDPQERNNDYGMQFLHSAAAAAGSDTVIRQVGPEVATALFEAEHWDLVITNWGHDPAGGPSAAKRLLGLMRHGDLNVPAIVFASGSHADANKEQALRAGAIGYAHQWETLFRLIAERFAPGSRTG